MHFADHHIRDIARARGFDDAYTAPVDKLKREIARDCSNERSAVERRLMPALLRDDVEAALAVVREIMTSLKRRATA